MQKPDDVRLQGAIKLNLGDAEIWNASFPRAAIRSWSKAGEQS